MRILGMALRPDRAHPHAVALALMLFLTAPTCASETLAGKVIRVADGDTLTLLSFDNRQHTIRIEGIDAPERTQPYSQRARQALIDMAQGKPATAECGKVDKFLRDVCRVLVDGQDVGLAQIEAGLAWHFVRYAREQAEEMRSAYSKAESEAKLAKRGLWRDPAPVPPWDFRAAKSNSP